MDGKSYLVEFVRVGNQYKVTACDPDTGREVSIIGPANATRKHLTDVAVKKLEYMMGKKKD